MRCTVVLAALVAVVILAEAAGAEAASTWTQLHPAVSPSPRSGAGMAYDPSSGQVVLFGGFSGRGSLGDTWLWNGSTWSQSFPSTAPSARQDPGMAYDAASGQLLMFGGTTGAGGLNDTWLWSRGTWTQLHPTTSPPNRQNPAFAYDPATHQIVMFGGFQYSPPDGPGGSDRTDTWVWNGATWTQQHPATSPPALDGANLTWDSGLNKLVLFGGGSNDIWTWDGTTWTKLALTTKPSARTFSVMASDPGIQRLVMFGGHDNAGAAGDTWTFNGTWTQQHPQTSPPPREAAASAYDPGSGHLLLFGGATTGEFDDTWVWGSLAVDQPPLPAATSGLNYFAVLHAIAGTGQLTWSLASGTLPPGLRLSTAGFIDGMPTTVGSSTFTLRVTDSTVPAPQTATRTFTITVLQGPRPGVYVANGANSEIHGFAFGSAGNVTPTATIAGSNTALNGPAGLAFDTSGDLYVARLSRNPGRRTGVGAGRLRLDGVTAGEPV